jgi:hypothetical protein
MHGKILFCHLFWIGYELGSPEAHVFRIWSPSGGTILGDFRDRALLEEETIEGGPLGMSCP